ncbi:MAG: metal-dependent hydrolase [Selenomonadaceae bacterium]|nr:metal-dependent hydrolase [Selenomonadaceae bacterium]MBQ7629225.1 metal-dependent hydrolase [Selenomonadaceae bacterium]
MLKFNYYGHACFQLDDGKYKVLFDPFITGNPQATIKPAEVKTDYLFITHAHGDHIGDTDIIVRNNGATVIGIPELMDFGGENVKTIGMNLGGTVKLPFGYARMVPAMHSSGVQGGIACGFVLSIGGKIIYFAGDTCLFGDMKLIGERDAIDYAILPIGGHFTMDAIDAARAVEFLGAKNAIPVHYDTWQPIEQDPEEFKKLVKGATVHIVKPGESIELV